MWQTWKLDHSTASLVHSDTGWKPEAKKRPTRNSTRSVPTTRVDGERNLDRGYPRRKTRTVSMHWDAEAAPEIISWGRNSGNIDVPGNVNVAVPLAIGAELTTGGVLAGDGAQKIDWALEAQMWMQQGADGKFLDIGYGDFEPTAEWAPTTPHDSAPAFSFDGFPFTSNHQWADQLLATSTTLKIIGMNSRRSIWTIVFIHNPAPNANEHGSMLFRGNVLASGRSGSRQDGLQVVRHGLVKEKIELNRRTIQELSRMPHRVAQVSELTKIQSQDSQVTKIRGHGHEVFELLSDSDAEEDLNSDLEVIEALRRTSRSSSVIAPSIPDSTVDDDLDGDIGGGPSHDGMKGQDKYSSYSSFLPDQGDCPAENDFLPADNFPLVESDTIWEDGGKSFEAAKRIRWKPIDQDATRAILHEYRNLIDLTATKEIPRLEHSGGTDADSLQPELIH
ncbi:hypothetical protein K438DRAFT_1769579 [Mycena galopus ATCC 62051]|nr:hypothetical protein K438DRAFT_1769579 [Mycena galopus ATCC 62051]